MFSSRGAGSTRIMCITTTNLPCAYGTQLYGCNTPIHHQMPWGGGGGAWVWTPTPHNCWPAPQGGGGSGRGRLGGALRGGGGVQVGRFGVGGPQWVRFALPQSAPTAPATTVFIALSSVCHLVFIAFSFRCSSAGQGARSLSSLVHCSGQLSPVVLWGCKHSARRTPYAWSIGIWAVPLPGQGRTCRSRVNSGWWGGGGHAPKAKRWSITGSPYLPLPIDSRGQYLWQLTVGQKGPAGGGGGGGSRRPRTHGAPPNPNAPKGTASHGAPCAVQSTILLGAACCYVGWPLPLHHHKLVALKKLDSKKTSNTNPLGVGCCFGCWMALFYTQGLWI